MFFFQPLTLSSGYSLFVQVHLFRGVLSFDDGHSRAVLWAITLGHYFCRRRVWQQKGRIGSRGRR